MNIIHIIEKKKLNQELSKEEIDYIVSGVTKSKFPDYQIAALLMAIRLNGMSDQEIANLTIAMAHSGDVVNLDGLIDFPVDKHSTGGVGDTTSLILVPLVAACDVPVAKMSGRGLGHTGGTIDKLESIPGMSISLSSEQFKNNIKSIGLSIIGQTGNLAPADKILYALRDVTSTVDSIPLIASSIMSKKIAGGAKGIVLDVKAGAGAILPDIKDSISLAEKMVSIGRLANRPVVAVISSMEEPLGTHVGNALEVKEAIDVLAGRVQGPLLEVSLLLGSYMLLICGKCENLEQAKAMLLEALKSGKGLEKLRLMIEAQGGDSSICDDTSKLPQAPYTDYIYASKEAYVASMDTMSLGYIAQELGAGRLTKDDIIDPSVGYILMCRVGQKLQKDQPIAKIFAKDKESFNIAKEGIEKAIKLSDTCVDKTKLIYAIVDQNGIKNL